MPALGLGALLTCDSVQVMFVPQRAIAAPGATLLEQVLYPSALPQDPASLADTLPCLADLLRHVGLSDLLQRVQGDWLASHNWQGTNSSIS